MRDLTRVRLIEVTNNAGRTHLVTEDRFAAGPRNGRFVALCGKPVLSASLTTEGREWCPPCARRAVR